MTQTAKALYSFYSSFGIPAYTETTVPDDAELPYITYSLPETEPLEPASHNAQIWYYGTSNADLLAKADAIKAAIGTGKLLRCEGGGYVCLRPQTPLMQLMVEQDPEIRRIRMMLQINCYHI